MEIYKAEPKEIIRVSINKKGHSTECFNIINATQDEVRETFTNFINSLSLPNVVPTKEPKTRIDIRHAKGAKNGKSISISFYGMDPKSTKKLIIDFLS